MRLVYGEEPPLVYAVGDVHGCLDLLRSIEADIALDRARNAPETPAVLVLLGDLIDRGPASAQVIDHVMARAPDGLERVCLKGNHEELMLQFVEEPRPDSLWLKQGGWETLLSYGVSGTALQSADRRTLRRIVDAYIPPEHIEFMRSMPVLLQTPEHVYVHAGIDETKTLDEQPVDVLLWYRDDFQKTFAPVGRQVVHGHSFAQPPIVTRHRVAIDTGAYRTGVLTAAVAARGHELRILQHEEVGRSAA